MCDYSLETYRSRPAQVGERYETHQFPSFSVGFIAPGDPPTAVCMACDTKLTLEGIPERLIEAGSSELSSNCWTCTIGNNRRSWSEVSTNEAR